MWCSDRITSLCSVPGAYWGGGGRGWRVFSSQTSLMLFCHTWCCHTHPCYTGSCHTQPCHLICRMKSSSRKHHLPCHHLPPVWGWAGRGVIYYTTLYTTGLGTQTSSWGITPISSPSRKPPQCPSPDGRIKSPALQSPSFGYIWLEVSSGDKIL